MFKGINMGVTDRAPGPLKARFRWMERRDQPFVAHLDGMCHRPWGAPLLNKMVTAGTLKVRVALVDEKPVAFLGYEPAKDHLHLLGLGVHPDFRRRGVARALLAWLIEDKLGGRRARATADVPETCLDVQLTLKACGWKPDPHQPVVRGLFDDPVEDAFVMVIEKGGG